MIEKQFCEELQELLDRYKAQLPVPTIMRNAQKIFRNTLSFCCHPELHPETNLETLERFLMEGPQAKLKYVWEEEFKDFKNEQT